MSFIALPAFCMASRVSRLMLADSMALICCSNVPICAIVWSRLCSCVFFRFRAALAAVVNRDVSTSQQTDRASRGNRAHRFCLC